MGWKMVRDAIPAWAEKHGVSGEYRVAPDPVASLRKKLFEEAGEFVETGAVSELYDLLDVVAELIVQLDADGSGREAHLDKIRRLGGFADHTEWSPVPASEREHEVP